MTSYLSVRAHRFAVYKDIVLFDFYTGIGAQNIYCDGDSAPAESRTIGASNGESAARRYGRNYIGPRAIVTPAPSAPTPDL
ncbi:hypothetical protein EVAR_53390_1 [Eumeta japonica]|uniref:Uncharacterized protein n=1 Tax=Eumeta variegata TaxID=151549 RepID=A0A4C1Y6I2_EUMVA|nr:hypothetical protein EVAR_53390_1 [Eumeta japonica]